MKTLYLHVGWRKTGTSAIQALITQNLKADMFGDICYPPVGLMAQQNVFGGSEPLAHHHLGRLDDDQVGESWAALADYVQKSDCDKFLVSSEAISGKIQAHGKYTADLKQYLAPFDRVVFLIWLRRQDEYMSSMYAQLLKDGLRPRERHFPIGPLPDGFYFYLLERFQRTHRNAELKLFLYNHKEAKVLDQFTDVVGVDQAHLNMEIERGVNARVTPTLYRLQGLVNYAATERDIPGTNLQVPLMRAAEEAKVNDLENTGAIPLSLRHRFWCENRYYASNDKLAEIFGLDRDYFRLTPEALEKIDDFNIPDVVPPAYIDQVLEGLEKIKTKPGSKNPRVLTEILEAAKTLQTVRRPQKVIFDVDPAQHREPSPPSREAQIAEGTAARTERVAKLNEDPLPKQDADSSDDHAMPCDPDDVRPEPSLPKPAESPAQSLRCTPDALGDDIDGWNVHREENHLRYTSGQWHETRDYVMNTDGVSIADGPQELRMVFGMGGGWFGTEGATNAFPYHILSNHNAEIEASKKLNLAGSVAQAVLERRHSLGQALPAYVEHVFSTEPDTGMTRQGLICRVASDIIKATRGFGREAAAHALILSPGETAARDSFEPTRFIHSCLKLRDALERTTQQQGAMHFLYLQWNGTTRSGHFDNPNVMNGLWQHDPLAPLIFATPLYPFEMNPQAPFEPSEKGFFYLVRTLGVALHCAERNEEWHPPIAWMAQCTENRIEVTFDTLSPLVIDAENGNAGAPGYGFSLAGAANDIKITEVQAGPRSVQLTLSDVPRGDNIRLRYAFGMKPDPATPALANRGALRDSFEVAFDEGPDVHRWAAAFELEVHRRAWT